jgi:uncharacterized protein
MENLQPLFDRKLSCPICDKEFTSKKIRSKFIKIQGYDTDFCPIYKEGAVNGLLYNIYVCPHCGYSFSEDFSTYFPPTTKAQIEEKICKKWVPHNFGNERTIDDSIQTYKLSSLCASIKKERHVLVAGLYLRTAWLYRLKGNHSQEKRFLLFAQKEYEESFSNDDFKGTQMSEIRLLYLLGDISKRIGHMDKATTYFSMVIERQKKTVETHIVDLAKERWYEMRNTK